MFDGSDTVVLYNELAYEEVLPVNWAPLSGSMDAALALSYTKRNVVMRDGVIVSDIAVQDRSNAKEEMRRLDEEHQAAKLVQ